MVSEQLGNVPTIHLNTRKSPRVSDIVPIRNQIWAQLLETEDVLS